jgi:hypothetical protein
MMFQQPLLKAFTESLSIFEIVSLSSVSKEFRTTILTNQNLGVLIATKVIRDVDELYPFKESFVDEETGRLCFGLEPKEMANYTPLEPLLRRIIDTTTNQSIQSWPQEMKKWIRWLSISVLNKIPTWMYQVKLSPLYPHTRTTEDSFINAWLYLRSSIKNRLTTRIQPTMFKSKAKMGQYKPLTKEQTKCNRLLDVFQDIRSKVFPPVQYQKGLLNIFRLLNQTQSLQSGSDIHLKIAISPPNSDPNTLVVFSSGKKMPIPRLTIQLAKAPNRTFKRIWLPEDDDEHPDIYKEETIVRITDGSKGYTEGIVCAIYPDGHVVNTSLFEQYESFLEEFDRDIWTNSGIIGKICNACIFCHKPLSRNDSLENGFGSVCEKKWALHLYRAKDNRAIINHLHSTTVKGAFDLDLLILFKPLDREEPPRKKRRYC